MTPRNVKYTRSPAPLRCYKCGHTDKLTVGDDVVKRSRRRKGDVEPHRYLHVPVNCRNCGHEFYSMHPDAIKQARKKDRDRARFHKGRQPQPQPVP